MLTKTAENCFSFDVSSRESFSYKFDFEHQCVIITYSCKTDSYQFVTTYDFVLFDFKVLRIDSKDYSLIVSLINQSVTYYINHNIISGSHRRSWIKFRDELSALYNSLAMSQHLLL